jgi:hypothetical protein
MRDVERTNLIPPCSRNDDHDHPLTIELSVQSEEAKMASAILKDKDYDLISVIYHASQGCETARLYAADAEKENDKEAAGFFNKALELNEQLVQKGKELLKQRL